LRNRFEIGQEENGKKWSQKDRYNHTDKKPPKVVDNRRGL